MNAGPTYYCWHCHAEGSDSSGPCPHCGHGALVWLRQLPAVELLRQIWVHSHQLMNRYARQGEALGMKWEYLHKTNRTIRVRKALQRQKWRHSCDDPHACGAAYHHTEKCKQP